MMGSGVEKKWEREINNNNNNNNNNKWSLGGVVECVGGRASREEAKKMEEKKWGQLVSLRVGGWKR